MKLVTIMANRVIYVSSFLFSQYYSVLLWKGQYKSTAQSLKGGELLMKDGSPRKDYGSDLGTMSNSLPVLGFRAFSFFRKNMLFYYEELIN